MAYYFWTFNHKSWLKMQNMHIYIRDVSWTVMKLNYLSKGQHFTVENIYCCIIIYIFFLVFIKKMAVYSSVYYWVFQYFFALSASFASCCTTILIPAHFHPFIICFVTGDHLRKCWNIRIWLAFCIYRCNCDTISTVSFKCKQGFNRKLSHNHSTDALFMCKMSRIKWII